jgi:hypothetical protein
MAAAGNLVPMMWTTAPMIQRCGAGRADVKEPPSSLVAIALEASPPGGMTLASRSAPGQTTISLCPVSNWLGKTALLTSRYRRAGFGAGTVVRGLRLGQREPLLPCSG